MSSRKIISIERHREIGADLKKVRDSLLAIQCDLAKSSKESKSIGAAIKKILSVRSDLENKLQRDFGEKLSEKDFLQIYFGNES